MKKFAAFAISMMAVWLSAGTIRLVPAESLSVDWLGNADADFKLGAKGWNVKKEYKNGTIKFGDDGAEIHSDSTKEDIRFKRELNAAELKRKMKGEPVVLVMTAKTTMAIEGNGFGLTAGIGWYKQGWKTVSQSSRIRATLLESTGGEWKRIVSAPCNFPEDAEIMIADCGIYCGKGSGVIRKLEMYPAKAEFLLKADRKRIQSVRIVNAGGETVYDGDGRKIILPYPYGKFEGVATLTDGSSEKFSYPCGGVFAKGTRMARICIAKNAGRHYVATAAELQRIILAMTGEKLPIIHKDTLTSSEVSGTIVVGNTIYRAEWIREQLEKHSVAVVVHPTDGGLIFAGTYALGITDGVYRSFERAGGRFYVKPARMPYVTELWTTEEKFPDDGVIRIDETLIEAPRFSQIYCSLGDPTQTREYKNKVYGYIWGGHCSDLMVPQSVYLKSHPEYYALLPNGERLGKTSSMRVHLCLSNPEVQEIAFKNISNWIDQQPDKKFFEIGQGDGPNWCCCAGCKALDTPNTGCSGRFWAFNNKLLKKLREAYPDKRFLFYSYSPSTEIPPDNVSIPYNAIIQFCPYCYGGARSQYQALDKLPNRIAYRNLKNWCKILKPGQMMICEYPPTYCTQPSAGWRSLFEKMKFYAGFPQITSWMTCGFSNNSFYHFSLFVIRELEWNPSADVAALTAEFFPAFYGKSAPYMREIYEKVSSKEFNGMCEYYAPGMFSRQELRMIYALFAEAEKNAETPVILDRVRFEKFPYLMSDLIEFNPANAKAEMDAEFAAKLQDCLKIYLEVRDPEYTSRRSGHLVKGPFSLQGIGYGRWLENISGLPVGSKELFQSELVAELVKEKEPLAFLLRHSDKTKLFPMGEHIRLGGAGMKTVTRLVPAEVADNRPLDFPLMEEDTVKSKQTRKSLKPAQVLSLAPAKPVAFPLPYVSNIYDALLEVTACMEEGAGNVELVAVLNNGTPVRKKFTFRRGQWERFIIPLRRDELKCSFEVFKNLPDEKLYFGMDTSTNKVKLQSDRGIIIGKLRMLF